MAACKENLAHLSVIHLPVSMSGLNAHVSALLCCLTHSKRKKERKKSESQRTNKVTTREFNELSQKAK